MPPLRSAHLIVFFKRLADRGQARKRALTLHSEALRVYPSQAARAARNSADLCGVKGRLLRIFVRRLSRRSERDHFFVLRRQPFIDPVH